MSTALRRVTGSESPKGRGLAWSRRCVGLLPPSHSVGAESLGATGDSAAFAALAAFAARRLLIQAQINMKASQLDDAIASEPGSRAECVSARRYTLKVASDPCGPTRCPGARSHLRPDAQPGARSRRSFTSGGCHGCAGRGRITHVIALLGRTGGFGRRAVPSCHELPPEPAHPVSPSLVTPHLQAR